MPERIVILTVGDMEGGRITDPGAEGQRKVSGTAGQKGQVRVLMFAG